MKNRKTAKKVIKKGTALRGGFTLVETMLAVFIFTLSMALLSSIFASFMKNYSVVKKNQKNLENAQYALNLMQKTIRTSVLANTGAQGKIDFDAEGKMLKMYDESQSKCQLR